jgi:hypothetical protein
MVFQVDKTFSLKEPEFSSPYPQNPAIGICPSPVESIYILIFFLITVDPSYIAGMPMFQKTVVLGECYFHTDTSLKPFFHHVFS